MRAISRIVGFAFKFAILLTISAGILLYPPIPAETDHIKRASHWHLNQDHVARSVSPLVLENAYPESLYLHTGDMSVEAVVDYSLQPEFKQYVDNLLLHYRPDFAAVVVLDPETGDILSLSSHVRDGEAVGNLTIHSGFPAASIFKIVTASAALDGGATPTTKYEYNGKDTSLYKKDVLRHKRNKWTRSVSFSRAFGRSINTVFGRLGVFDVGGDSLIEYAGQFGFNQSLPVDLKIEPSVSEIDPEDEWSVAEAASGYTNAITMSPIHAAMMAGAIVNDGVAIEPRLVESARHLNGPELYRASRNSQRILDSTTAQDLRELMRYTVTKGSARKSFRGFFKGQYADLDIGGKTGSLTGYNPKGRTEWFVGYGDSGSDQIAVAAVVVNKEKWRVKPSYLARKIFEEYYRTPNSSG